MSIEVKHLREELQFSDATATIKEMFRTSNLESELLCLGPGQYLSPEISDICDAIFWVLEGEGVFEAGDEVLVLTRNNSLLVPAGDSVGLINENDKELVVLRVKGPGGF